MQNKNINSNPNKNNQKKPQRGRFNLKNSFFGNLLLVFLIFLFLTTAYSLIMESNSNVDKISLSQLAQDIKDEKIKEISVKGDNLEILYTDGIIKKSQKETATALTDTFKNYNIDPIILSKVTLEVKNPSGFFFWIIQLAPFIIPILFIFLFIWFLSRQVKGAGVQAFTFGQSKARIISPNDKMQKVTFADVAGVKEAKNELSEIVDFLKNPKKFFEIGARIPKGIILMGPPGSGKTLLARAVAGEAGVQFFSISGSEFVEMFVGVGASVTGDTPVLTRTNKGTILKPISEVVDQYYKEGEAGMVKRANDLSALGFKPLKTGFRGVASGDKKFFGGSEWNKVTGVLRHKVDEVYKIHYRGGRIRTTGDHSIFVRQGNMIKAKQASELEEGDILVNLPFKVRSVFVPSLGTTHKIRAHTFYNKEVYLDLYDSKYQEVLNQFNFALENKASMSQYEIAKKIGVSQATVGNWQNDVHWPRFFNSNVKIAGAPPKIKVIPDLMRLFGYFSAEGGTAEYYTQFVFGLHEKKLHEDCAELIRKFFKIEPKCAPVRDTNSYRINISSPLVARFFENHLGNGSHNKHIPEFLWDTDKENFLAYLEGYAKGDGYTTKDGKLSMTSVSKQLIRELAWLAAMHGIQVDVRETIAPAGRVIKLGGKPLPETKSWNLIIGKSSHPFSIRSSSPFQFKKTIVTKIEKEPYKGYVYDLCGCENEAFFGGEKPVLLHNSRVRDLFKLAKQAAPAIIFIDELDAVGRVRGTGVGGGNDEREQTLNQILVEMDGFEPTEKVIVMSSTNRPDVLDPALLRPGRFDRRVFIDLPDRSDREEILKIHSKNKPFAEDVDLKVIAERTPGFSGADLYSLMNEGAILAARENRKKVAQFDLIRAIEKVMLGPERQSHLLSKKEKEITAYHEAGHALVASVLSHADPVHKISIIARGHAGGYTLKLPVEEKRLQSKKEFLDDIAVSLGGYVTELSVFGDLTTGPSNDLQVATALTIEMVTRYGMSDKLGPIAYEGSGGRVLFGKGVTDREHSEKVSSEIDAEVSKIINEAKLRAEKIIGKYRPVLDAIAKRLMEVETIEREEFEQIIIAHGITPKKRKVLEEIK